MPLQPGAIFAGYTIIRPLGSGGMGAVYLVQHPRLPRREALKILTGGAGHDAEFRARFAREADLAARLDHPNIVDVFDRGIHDDCPWITMRFVDGSDAARLIAQGPAAMPTARAVGIIDQAARGLDHAHRAGLLHRDIKPANLLVAIDGQGHDHVYVADFGIARSIDQSTAVTATGALVATIAYAAPELLEGKQLDHRVDVYALGCTLFQLLTGSVPYPRSSVAAVMRAHLLEPPPKVTELNPTLSPAFDAIIARAMAKDPSQRYQTCGELASAAVEAAFRSAPTERPPVVHPVPTMPPPPSAQPRPAHPRKSPRNAVIAAAVGLLVVVGLAVAFTQLDRDDSPGNATASTTLTTATATSSPITSTTPAVSGWGRSNELVALFPGLLPMTPNDVGYQGVRCADVNFANNGGTPAVECKQDNGLEYFVWSVAPGAKFGDGSDIKDHLFKTNIENDTTREEAWTRSTGTGRVRWSYDPGSNYGLLTVIFDDPARANIVIDVSWGHHTGQEIYDQWWAGAPI